MLNDYYKYEALQKHTYPEFGLLRWRGIVVHPEEGQFAVSYRGHRIAEICKDGNAYLYVQPQLQGASLCSRWSMLLTKYPKLSRHKRVDGRIHYTLCFGSGDPLNVEHRVKLRPDGVFEPADAITKIADKNREKYRQFNQALKKLKSVLWTQLRCGKYTEWHGRVRAHSWNKNTDLSDKLIAYTKQYKGKGYYSALDNAVLAWIESKDPAVAEAVAYLAFEYHGSETNGVEDLKRRISNALKAVQTRYLQEHCITIRESYNSLDVIDDKDRELQSTAGLREVSVPGEAEVC